MTTPSDPTAQFDEQPVVHPPRGPEAAAVQPYVPWQQQVAVARPPQSATAPGKSRSPVGVWLLSMITLGIYFIVWWYKINRELRDYHNSIQVTPGLSTLALFVPVAAWVTTFTTGSRIGQAQVLGGLGSSCSGGLGLLGSFFFGVHTIYYQGQLNRLWASQPR
jgi:Domain of unknown function (DUF4234)